MMGYVPSGSPRIASRAYRIALAVFFDIRVVLLGQYEESRSGGDDLWVSELSRRSFRGWSGGRTGSAYRGGEVCELGEEQLVGLCRVTSLGVRLSVRVLSDELEGLD